MKPARNHRCPCGSGRKFKQCCAIRGASAPGPSSSGMRLPLAVPSAVAARPSPDRRPCGGCSECCTALIINDANLVVPAGQRCPHACSAGCAVHGAGQPRTCREYYCDYTTSSAPLRESDRPDRVGAIVDRKRNPDKSPPMDRTTHVVACAADGLVRVLNNPYWRSVIRHDLIAGVPILSAQFGDPQNREVLGVQLRDDRLFCRLTSCLADSRPVLTTLQPVHNPPVQIALLIPEQGFIFDAEVLVRLLGQRAEAVITPSARSSANEELRFLFTRRQADWIRSLDTLRRECTVPINVGPGCAAVDLQVS